MNQRRSILGPEAPEPDRFLEIIETAGEFIRERAVPIIFGVIALILAVVLGVWWSNQRQNARVDQYAALYSAGIAIQNAAGSDDEKLAEAVAALEKAKDAPETAFLKAKASLLQEDGAEEAAEQFLQTAAKDGAPRGLFAQVNYGIALEKAGRLDEALAALEDSQLDKFKGEAGYESALTEAQTARARIHKTKGDYEAALAAHQRVADRYIASRNRAIDQAASQLVQKTRLLLETREVESSAESVADAYRDLSAWAAQEAQKPESERRGMRDSSRLLKEIEKYLSDIASAKRLEAEGKHLSAIYTLDIVAQLGIRVFSPNRNDYQRALHSIAEIHHIQKE
ncbi:MAG: hypothetical protein OXT69_07855 [Candidatus Poribacteria bacterium]|nr:hypothetical protein [Candidatus Poribacteria bacterium]